MGHRRRARSGRRVVARRGLHSRAIAGNYFHLSLSPTLSFSLEPRDCKNLAGGAWRPPNRGRTLEVTSPYTGRVIGAVALSDASDVDAAVSAARAAFPAWASTPIKERVVPLRRFHDLVTRHAADLANTVALESGKTPAEALAGIQRGLEVVDYALSLPNLDDGAALEVSPRRHLRGASRAPRRRRRHHAVQLPGDGPDVDVPHRGHARQRLRAEALRASPAHRVPPGRADDGGRLRARASSPSSTAIARPSTRWSITRDVRAVGFVGSTPAARARLPARHRARQARALPRRREEPPHRRPRRRRDARRCAASSTPSPAAPGQRCMAGERPRRRRRRREARRARSSAPRPRDPARRRHGRAHRRAGARPHREGNRPGGVARAREVLLDGRKASPPGGLRGRPLARARPSSTRPASGHGVRDAPSSSAPCSPCPRRQPRRGAGARAGDARTATPRASSPRAAPPPGTSRERATSGMIGVNVGVPVPARPVLVRRHQGVALRAGRHHRPRRPRPLEPAEENHHQLGALARRELDVMTTVETARRSSRRPHRARPPTPDGHGPKPIPVVWGAKDPIERGPLIGTVTSTAPAQRRSARTPAPTRSTARSPSPPARSTRAQARTSPTRSPTHTDRPVPAVVRPDEDRLARPVRRRRQQRLPLVLRAGLRHPADHRRHARAHPRARARRRRSQAGRLKVDGKILRESGAIDVVKAAIEPVWYLPGVAARFGCNEADLRRTLFEHTAGMFPELVTRGGPQGLPAADRRHDRLHVRRRREHLRPEQAARRARPRRVQRLGRLRLRHLHLPPVPRARHRGVRPHGAGRRRRRHRLQPQGRPGARRSDQVPRLQRPQAPGRRRHAPSSTSTAPSASPACRTCASRSSCPTCCTGSASRRSTASSR